MGLSIEKVKNHCIRVRTDIVCGVMGALPSGGQMFLT